MESAGDGAPIQKHFEEHYQLQEQEAALQSLGQFEQFESGLNAETNDLFTKFTWLDLIMLDTEYWSILFHLVSYF